MHLECSCVSFRAAKILIEMHRLTAELDTLLAGLASERGSIGHRLNRARSSLRIAAAHMPDEAWSIVNAVPDAPPTQVSGFILQPSSAEVP